MNQMTYRRYIFAEIPHMSMIPGGVMPVLHCSQYDKGRPLQFILDDADASVHAVTVRGRRPDGAAVTQAGITPDDGVYTWDVDETFTEIAGDCVCEVFYTLGDSEIGSQNFILRVEPGPVREGDPAPWSSVRLTAAGTYNVRPYAEAIVDVTGPAGSIDITENGTYNVARYAEAIVDVHQGGGSQAVADFVSRGSTGIMDLSAYEIEALRTYAFSGAAYSDIRVKAHNIVGRAFASTGAQTITIDGAERIQYAAFESAGVLQELHLTGITEVPQLDDPNAFSGTPIADGSGTIYFPAALVDAAKAATNWADFAAQIVGE